MEKAYTVKGSGDIWDLLKAHRLAVVEALLPSYLLFGDDKELGAFLIANRILPMLTDMTYPTHNAVLMCMA
eukprot:gene12502-biopygen9194